VTPEQLSQGHVVLLVVLLHELRLSVSDNGHVSALAGVTPLEAQAAGQASFALLLELSGHTLHLLLQPVLVLLINLSKQKVRNSGAGRESRLSQTEHSHHMPPQDLPRDGQLWQVYVQEKRQCT
jgi:hypothetical protein